MADVKGHHFREALAVGGDHFPGTQLHGLAVGQIKVESPFQAKPLAEELRVSSGGGMKFADASGSSDCGGDANGSDCRAAASFRYLKKNRAVPKIHLPRAFIETEDGVRAEASYGQIGESQFGARLRASANSGTMADKITDRGRARRRLFEQQFDVIHYLGDTRFLQLRCACRISHGDRPGKG